jgi:hypothetical protein
VTTSPLPPATATTQPPVVASLWGTANSPRGLQFVNDEDGWMITDDDGIMATTDGGATWHASYAGPEQPTAIDFVGPEDGWALRNAGATVAGSTPDTAGLMRTTDAGHTWSYLGEPSEGSLRLIDFSGPATGWSLTMTGGLLTTTDGGAAWTAVSAPSAGSLCATTSGVVWLGAASGAVEESEDGGASWLVSLPWATGFTPVDGPPIAPWMTCSGSAAWALYDWGEAAGSSAYVVLATADGGGHWAPLLSGLPDPARAGLPNASATVLSDGSAGDGFGWFLGGCGACGPAGTGVMVTVTGAATPKSAPLPGPAIEGSFADPLHGWIVAQAPATGPAPTGGYPWMVLASADGGATWHPVATIPFGPY